MSNMTGILLPDQLMIKVADIHFNKERFFQKETQHLPTEFLHLYVAKKIKKQPRLEPSI